MNSPNNYKYRINYVIKKTRERLFDMIPACIGGICSVALIILCIKGCISENERFKSRESDDTKRELCVAHLHNATKALSIEQARQEVGFAIVCLKDIQNICNEDKNTFEGKMTILRSLYKELSDTPRDIAAQEALLQKTMRVLFDGGQSCYKGNCKFKTYPFICQDIK